MDKENCKGLKAGILIAALLVVGLSLTATARADNNISGTFTTDDQVQFFHFTVTGSSTVTMFTTSYADGTDGFDPIL